MPVAASNCTSESPDDSVQQLLRRMQLNEDFPVLSETIGTLNRLSEASDKSTSQLADVIVRDYALTNKILKVVNSAVYASFARKVGTISRAIVVIGVETVRSLAASLLLFEQFSAEGRADVLKTLIGKSMFGALLAREIATHAGLENREEAFLAAMFSNLGELLVAYYLPADYAEVTERTDKHDKGPVQVQHEVLGASYEQLGIAIGRKWGFPQSITHSMKRVAEGTVGEPDSLEERLRGVAALAGTLTENIATGMQPDHADVKALLDRFKAVADIDPTRLNEALGNTRAEYRVLADSLVDRNSAPAALRALNGQSGSETGEVESGGDATIDDFALPGSDDTRPPTEQPDTILIDGLQEATAMLAAGASLQEIAQIVLETLYRAFGLCRVALCLRDARQQCYAGRLGFGGGIETYLRALRFPQSYSADVFHAALAKKADVHIEDLSRAGHGHGIPDWYNKINPQGSLLFLPLVLHDRSIGCIFAEHAASGGMQLEGGPLRLVRALRDQLVLGLQLRGSGA